MQPASGKPTHRRAWCSGKHARGYARGRGGSETRRASQQPRSPFPPCAQRAVDGLPLQYPQLLHLPPRDAINLNFLAYLLWLTWHEAHLILVAPVCFPLTIEYSLWQSWHLYEFMPHYSI